MDNNDNVEKDYEEIINQKNNEEKTQADIRNAMFIIMLIIQAIILAVIGIGFLLNR